MDLKDFLYYESAMRGLTLKEMGVKAGLSPATLSSSISRGEIGRASALKLSKYLGCKFTDIPGTRFYKAREQESSSSEENSLNNVNKSLTHSGFLKIKCPCCDNYVIISALCVGEMSDLE